MKYFFLSVLSLGVFASFGQRSSAKYTFDVTSAPLLKPIEKCQILKNEKSINETDSRGSCAVELEKGPNDIKFWRDGFFVSRKRYYVEQGKDTSYRIVLTSLDSINRLERRIKSSLGEKGLNGYRKAKKSLDDLQAIYLENGHEQEFNVFVNGLNLIEEDKKQFIRKNEIYIKDKQRINR